MVFVNCNFLKYFLEFLLCSQAINILRLTEKKPLKYNQKSYINKWFDKSFITAVLPDLIGVGDKF